MVVMSCAWRVIGSGSADTGAPESHSSEFATSPSTFVTCAKAVCETSATAAIDIASHGSGASDRSFISFSPGMVVRHGSGASECPLASFRSYWGPVWEGARLGYRRDPSGNVWQGSGSFAAYHYGEGLETPASASGTRPMRSMRWRGSVSRSWTFARSGPRWKHE